MFLDIDPEHTHHRGRTERWIVIGKSDKVKYWLQRER